MAVPVHANPVLRRLAVAAFVLAGLGIGAGAAHDYWTVGRHLQTTDNAYVRADYTTVAPRISGYVAEVLVGDNETVTAGQVLARIEDRALRVAVDRARAEFDGAVAAQRNLEAQIAQQQSVVDQERADISAAKATLALAQSDSLRYGSLRRAGYGSEQRAQQADTALREHSAQLRKQRAGLAIAERRVAVLESERARAEAECERNLAALRQAEINLASATITAPVSGTVGARALRVGQFVRIGMPLMAVVPLQAVYVVANYKETQLSRVRPGQPVEIVVDSFPDTVLRGHVDSVAPASGREFALMPADNAAGNFTKIVQRVPVKIVLDDGGLAGRLRPGMSAETTIDTRMSAAR